MSLKGKLYIVVAFIEGLLTCDDVTFRMILDKIPFLKNFVMVMKNDASWHGLIMTTLFLVAILGIFVFLVCKQIQRKYFDITFLILLFSSFVFAASKMFLFHTIICKAFLAIITGGFAVMVIMELYKFYCGNNTSNVLLDSSDGFIADHTDGQDLDLQWDDFARTIVNRLRHTKVEEEAFAVGISGQWGSGKTTFLEAIKKELKRNNDNIIEFSPWLSSSPQQIIVDFFTILNSYLGKCGIYISDEVDKYVRSLSECYGSNISSLILNIFAKKESLSEEQKKIEKGIQKLQSPLYILIDDTDRLDEKEILEVLRLVRNTAKFKNLIYILTYDKTYVNSKMKGYVGTNEAVFIDKVINVEFTLPLFESQDYYDLFSRELSAHLQHSSNDRGFSHNIPTMLANELSRKKKDIRLEKLLPTFRAIKRFTNHLLTVIDVFLDEKKMDDINLRNLLWLEIIHYTNENLYDALCHDANNLLKEETYIGSKEKIYWYENKELKFRKCQSHCIN